MRDDLLVPWGEARQLLKDGQCLTRSSETLAMTMRKIDGRLGLRRDAG